MSDVHHETVYFTGRVQGVGFRYQSLQVSKEFDVTGYVKNLPDGRVQEPGGWNRVVLHVKDLPARIDELRGRGVRSRNEMEVGPGGKQIQLEDPDGNPVELFEPAER